jgi:hypothetical protein
LNRDPGWVSGRALPNTGGQFCYLKDSEIALFLCHFSDAPKAHLEIGRITRIYSPDTQAPEPNIHTAVILKTKG